MLPFDHFGPDAAQAWLADGFSEALIADLSALQVLRVLSRTSSRTLRHRSQDARSIGRRHGVRYLVKGSCRSLASRVRVSVRLIDVHLDASVWSEAFDGNVEQAFDLQSTMTSAVTQVLERKQADHPALKVARFVTDSGMGSKDAERWLEVAVDRGFAHRAFLEHHDPMLRPLHEHPGFSRLLDRIAVRP